MLTVIIKLLLGNIVIGIYDTYYNRKSSFFYIIYLFVSLVLDILDKSTFKNVFIGNLFNYI